MRRAEAEADVLQARARAAPGRGPGARAAGRRPAHDTREAARGLARGPYPRPRRRGEHAAGGGDRPRRADPAPPRLDRRLVAHAAVARESPEAGTPPCSARALTTRRRPRSLSWTARPRAPGEGRRPGRPDRAVPPRGRGATAAGAAGAGGAWGLGEACCLENTTVRTVRPGGRLGRNRCRTSRPAGKHLNQAASHRAARACAAR